jgi:hypothetical protein
MNRRAYYAGAAGLLSLALAACTQETPSEIGGSLLPPGDVRTFEVILEPAQYLVFDTAFSGYAKAFDTSVKVAARKFEGVTDANTLIRLGTKPASIQVRDSSNNVRADTLPKYSSGTLVVKVDTFQSTKGRTRLGLYQTAQGWDARSATWTMRVDTGGVRLPWTTPGGTRGAAVGSVTYTGVDSLLIPVDSQTVAALTNPADTLRGVLISVDSADAINGARIRINSLTLRLPTRSTIRPDTVIETNIGAATSTFVFTPDPPAVATTARVSGVPAWRAILAFSETFQDTAIPCPDGSGCVLRLGDIHLNQAELLLRPAGSPAGFSPEDSISVEARAVLRTSNLPLARSPLGDAVGAFRFPVPPNRFRDSDTGPEIALPVSAIVNAMITDTTTAQSPVRPPRNIALLTGPEAFSFGFATFRAAPRLRLILTASTEQR